MPDLESRLQSALSGRYRVGREIGRGGMATVFLAEDVKHGREVAIKVLHPELVSSGGGERFLREVEIAARLKHPHILSLIDSGEAGGFYYFVMPYVEGESLRDRLEREKQLPIEDAIEITREVADGLGYAHRQGVVHRDIKPANIMLSEGHAAIADFGVARAMEEEGQGLTRTGMAVGTPQYMSPEQATGTEEVDGRTDLYALGCVLYEMLAGAPPLTGPTPQATAGLRLTETATALPVLRDTVPGGLDRVTQKLLAKTPADRYPRAEQLAKALASPEVWASEKRHLNVGRHLIEATVALTLLAAGVWLTTWFTGGSGGQPVELDPELVAVLPFENVAGDPELDQWSGIAAGLISGGLDETGYVRLVEQATVAAEWDALPEGLGDGDGSTWIQTFAGRVGAGVLVRGDYYAQGDSVHFRARIIEAANGNVSELGPYASSNDVPTRAIEELREQIMIYVVGPSLIGPNTPYVDMPRSYAALLEFNEGKKEFGASSSYWDIEAALRRFLRAAEIDPTWDFPLGMVMIQYLNLARYDLVDSLRAALELRRAQLPPMVRVLQLPTASAVLSGDRLGLRRAYLATAEELDRPRDPYMVAYGAQLNNRPRECLESIAGAGVGDDVWDTLPWCLHSLGRHGAELDTVRAAILTQPDDALLLGREAIALAALGRPEETRRVVAESRRVSMDAEFRFTLEVSTGLELQAHGKAEEGQVALEQGVAWYAARPPAEMAAPRHRYNFAQSMYAAGHWTEAREQFASLRQELAADPRVFLHQNADVSLAGYLGTLAARLGEEDEARRMEEELRQMDRPFLLGHNTYWRAAIATLLGERERGVELLSDALSTGLMWLGFGTNRMYPKWEFHIDPDFESLRGYGPFEELIGPQD